MSWKNALGNYIKTPGKYPKDVILDTPDFVVIRDAFPKSYLHFLVLPKAVEVNVHPLTAFEDDNLYQKTLEMVKQVERLCAAEFIRKRGYCKDISVKSGIHSVPSMNHLHVHVMTSDLSSPRLKNRTHFNSFETDFFVPFRAIPDIKVANLKSWQASKETLIKGDILLKGENYGNKFAKAKRQLDDDFERQTRYSIPEEVELDDWRVLAMIGEGDDLS